MSRAIQLARRGQYTTRPNPNVGCVLVANERLISEGFHYQAGQAHAEVQAIKSAQKIPKGTTAYVTLEPCNHQGRTGPCTQALIESGIKHVVYGMVDPNPRVSGEGLEALRKAGIEVRGPVLETEVRKLNPGFILRMQQQRPWIRCKIAASLDGATAMASGESQWITGKAARADVQKWRAKSCAILTGIASVLQDDSRLTLREDELGLANSADILVNPPLRVVLDSHLSIPLDASILQGTASTLLMTLESTAQAESKKMEQLKELNRGRVDVVAFPESSEGRIPLTTAVEYLAKDYQCNELLVEAGATLTGQFMQQNLLDECIVYQAPVLMGGQTKPMFDLSIEKMADKKNLQITDMRKVGDSLRLVFRIKDS
jgi:diaminohydroxyphosphoribosylaminopyrimidine deaminase/5-amino-6-(5-phosphoribosylamino)uracil reductase